MNPMLNEANAHERLPQRKPQPQDDRGRVIEDLAVAVAEKGDDEGRRSMDPMHGTDRYRLDTPYFSSARDL